MEINCNSCGQNYEVTPEHAGMEFECTQCQTPIYVPADLFAVKPVPGSPAAAEAPQTANTAYDDHGSCPKCHAPLKPNAKICIECGHNLQLGLNVKTVATAKKAGSFGIAIGIAAGTAVVSALIWAGIAIFTGFEIGWIAWGIGVAVGASVIIMTDERSARLGLVAVVLVIGAILLGKLILFNYGVASFLQKKIIKEPVLMKIAIRMEMMEKGEFEEQYSQWLSENGLDNPTAIQSASKEMQELIDQEEKKVQAKFTKLTPAEKERLSSYCTKQMLSRVPLSEKLKNTCSFWDFLWLFLAISSAWKMATGQNESA